MVKICGANDPKTLSKFLRSIFPGAFCRKSWKTIFEDLDKIKSEPSSRTYKSGMIKLIEKFVAGNNKNDFLAKIFPEIFKKIQGFQSVAQDLMKLCNHIMDLKSQNKSNIHLLNFRRSVISCFVLTFSISDLRKAGWRVHQRLWESCKQKRENDGLFLDIDPSTNAGRKVIDESVKKEIELLWLNNSRQAAKCSVTNPANRSERKTGRRLSKPARHIILESNLFKDQIVSYGTIWKYRLWWVLPPTCNDGLCHWCLELRNLIAYVHKQIPHTDPLSIEGRKPDNHEKQLKLWKPNEYPETVDSWTTLISSRFNELPDAEKTVLEWRLKTRLMSMKKLEHHFRLSNIIYTREKQLDKDMPVDLLRIWADFMTPVTVCRGGLKAEKNSKQPHNLSLVTVHGLMLQYRDLSKPNVTESTYAFSMNLCEHSTKTSYFSYQHILHALNQPQVKAIFDEPRFKRIEFSFDCGPSYQSKWQIYFLTKGFALEMLPRRFESIRWSPRCHCHGKSNLDRRFSSLTTWKTNWENDEFHDTILNIDDLYACYIDQRDISNQSRISVDHKDPIITDISIIKLKSDTKDRRPYVLLTGLKGTNSVSLCTTKTHPSDWKLYNNVLPVLREDVGEDITHLIREGGDGEVVTDRMRHPGAPRKQINLAELESNPDVVMSRFKSRSRFIERGNLSNTFDSMGILL